MRKAKEDWDILIDGQTAQPRQGRVAVAPTGCEDGTEDYIVVDLEESQSDTDIRQASLNHKETMG